MTGLLRYAMQAVLYALIAVPVGYLSSAPDYTHLSPDLALLKLSFSHAGDHLEECRRLTQEELDALAPNMRRPTECSRRRVDLLLELEIDGETVFRDRLAPSGLAGDGASTVYERFPLEPGRHEVAVRLRDSRRESGFDWHGETSLETAAGRVYVIDFNAATGGFRFL